MDGQTNSTQPTTAPGYPYNQRHAATSNPQAHTIANPTISYTATTGPHPQSAAKAIAPAAVSSSQRRPTGTSRLQNLINRDAQMAAVKLIDQRQRQKQALFAAQQQYHTAWQNYYQKYYENYYVAAMQEQQKRFAEQQAAVVDSREADGKLEQAEVQQRLQSDVLDKVKQAAGQARRKWWFIPSAVGLAVIVVVLFLQYNSVLAARLAAFVSPGSSANQTIIIGTGTNQPVSDGPRIIIPKINVNAPVTYGLTDLSEKSAQTALQNGPINYPVTGATAIPGQKGNTVILGHSSADFFAPGDYKFIFVQLNRLAEGDLFYLDYGQVRYTYKVAQTKVIEPNQINELNLGTDRPYATLVTCDPPGTIAHRLLVIADQVSPDPNGATAEQSNEATATTITGKPKTLLEGIFGN